MQTLTRLLAAASLAGALLAQTPGAPPKTHLKVGDAAPDFTLSTSLGQPFKLSDMKGKKGVVLAFFPAAFTGGWTKELTAYQSGIAKFDEASAQVVAISTDNQPTLSHWAKELNAAYPLASDFQRKVTALYGVLIPDRGMANRTTFVIDVDGIIQYIEEGNAAVDPTGAITACSRIKKQ